MGTCVLQNEDIGSSIPIKSVDPKTCVISGVNFSYQFSKKSRQPFHEVCKAFFTKTMISKEEGGSQATVRSKGLFKEGVIPYYTSMSYRYSSETGLEVLGEDNG